MQNSDRKKIIIVGPAYPYRGGPSTFVSYIYKSIQNYYDVKIYNYKLLYPEFLFPGTTQYDQSKEMKFIVPSERIINSINPMNWVNTAAMINREKADMIIFDWWHPFFGPCHYTISRLIKGKSHIVFITENFISHEQNKIDGILTRTGLKNADAFIALSSAVEKDLHSNFPSKKVFRSELPSFDLFSEVQGFDRNTCRKEFGYNDEDKVLLFFGYVRKYKGLDILLNAMPSILKSLPEIKLLVAGEFYDNEEDYKKIIDDLKINSSVTIINKFIANEEVGKYYTAADLNVLPYRSATQSAVLNVSYSFKKPVVASDAGGLSEFIKNRGTGIIVQSGSPAALTNGIIEFFNLKDSVDFEKNIEGIQQENKFKEFPELLNRIFKDF